MVEKLREVVRLVDVFDVIDTCHNSHLHQKVGTMWKGLKKDYYNLTEAAITIFVKHCPTCNREHPHVPSLKGAAHPIKSMNFRDRFQADLINYESEKHNQDYMGRRHKYCLVIKDHFTRLVYLHPLPNKEFKSVLNEFMQYFGFVRFPKILHTDNGPEFNASKLTETLKDVYMTMTTVKG